MLRTARAARAMFAFLLTLAFAFVLGKAAGQPITAFLMAFPVTVFCCAAISDDEARARIGKIAALSASAGAMFTLSALLHANWANHLVFVLVIGIAAYMRQYGGPWIPVGLAANVSYFFGAFLQPDTNILHWQWAGVAIGAACAVIVHQLVVPHRPWRRMQWSAGSIRMRMGSLLAAAVNSGGRENLSRVRRALADLADAVTIAETELEHLPGGRLAHRPLAEALIAVLVLAERTALQVQAAPARSGAAHLLEALEKLSRALTHYTPLPHEGELASVATAIEEMERALRLPPDFDAAKSAATLPILPKDRSLRSAVQSAAATALAIAGGAMLSPDRWYWAVITVFVMFSGTDSRGQALAKSLKRIFGTLAGILAAMGLVWLLHGSVHTALALMPLAIFCVFYAFIQSYTWMAFWITITVGLLFSATGRFSDAVMLLRLEETAIGALAGIAVAAIILPKSTHAHAREQLNDLLDATRAVLDAALPRHRLDRLHLTAVIHDFEAKLSSLREAVEPLRFFPMARATDQRDRISRELVLVSYWIHEITLAVRQLDSAGRDCGPARASEAVAALEKMIGRLRTPGRDETTAEEDDTPRPLPREAGDPVDAMILACDGVEHALLNVARLITDRTLQSRAFHF